MKQNRPELALAEAKQQAGDKVATKASRKFQQALQEKAQCMEEEIPACNGKSARKGILLQHVPLRPQAVL